MLIGNEAAFNGEPNGNHNAPEPGFRRGGIVMVGGPSSHTRIEGNYLHDNNGAGLAFRGDAASEGRKWRTEHWIVQQNRIANNRFGIWGRWGDEILLAANIFIHNSEGNFLTNISHLTELGSRPEFQIAPAAEILGPNTAIVGQSVHFDAAGSRDPDGHPLRFRWTMAGQAGGGPIFESIFNAPGFYRLGLTVDNGGLASLAWRDLLVVQPVAHELGTEGQAASWGFDLELNNDGKGRIRFEDDPHGIVGTRCLRFTPNPYPGAYATAIYPAMRNASWNFSTKKRVRFWIKAQNPNLPGFQNAGPVIRLLSREGQIELKPAHDANLMNDPAYSEARWLWTPMIVPLTGDNQWQRTTTGAVTLDRIDAISLSLDSWGGDPFTVWLDGLTVE